ncbi:spondin domain-containing protein [Teredinibacter purpureus]|uniref:spondin domain-containing protein n=1 Tax=Teredinibacter purpureus TaxID=2731756 RepID=UPI0005F80581|nr:spondin domain-containing protein [Teredinibacter purpureus]
MKRLHSFGLLGFVAMALTLSGCELNDDDDMTPTAVPTAMPTVAPTPEPVALYEIKVLNSTHGQPLSPVAVLLHVESDPQWQIGLAATAGLERLAESGDGSEFMAQNTVLAAMSGAGVIMPGQSDVTQVSAAESQSLTLTVATMLVNTNDAFTGVTAWPVGQLAVNESQTVITPIYDAGTEANSESVASIPGPAAGGEGYNSDRDDVDFVARHPGVVTMDDGLVGSALTQAHRFDNGAAVIRVTRMQ